MMQREGKNNQFDLNRFHNPCRCHIGLFNVRSELWLSENTSAHPLVTHRNALIPISLWPNEPPSVSTSVILPSTTRQTHPLSLHTHTCTFVIYQRTKNLSLTFSSLKIRISPERYRRVRLLSLRAFETIAGRAQGEGFGDWGSVWANSVSELNYVIYSPTFVYDKSPWEIDLSNIIILIIFFQPANNTNTYYCCCLLLKKITCIIMFVMLSNKVRFNSECLSPLFKNKHNLSNYSKNYKRAI